MANERRLIHSLWTEGRVSKLAGDTIRLAFARGAVEREGLPIIAIHLE
jgi:hypothetical protein